MKKLNKLTFTTAAIITIMTLSACSKNDSVSDHDHSHHHHAEAETHKNNHTEKQVAGEIVVDPEIANQMGITTETVKRAPLELSIKAIGSVSLMVGANAVASAPASGVITFVPGIELGRKVSAGQTIAKINTSAVSGGDINRVAKAAYDAAKAEVDRLKPLYDERLVTASQYNEAIKALEQARASYSKSASTGMISSPISGYLSSIDIAAGQYVDAGTAIATISSTSDGLTLKADVPQRHFKDLTNINDAIIVSPYDSKTVRLSEIGGRRINATESLSSSITGGFAPLYFSLPNNSSLPVGASVEVYLLGNGQEETISVPTTALSEQQGQMFVFLRLDDECYKKVPVNVGRTDGQRVEITKGLYEGDNVVVSGTTTVRIAESSGVVPQGHTHNH